MEPGTYILQEYQNLREGPGLQYGRKRVLGNLTEDRFERLSPGNRLEILEIKELSVSTWGRCEEGWVCLASGDKTYAACRRNV